MQEIEEGEMGAFEKGGSVASSPLPQSILRSVAVAYESDNDDD